MENSFLRMAMENSSMLPHLYDLIYGGEIGMKLEVAKKLFRLYGEQLANDSQVMAHMKTLLGLHGALRRQMQLMEMDRICTECAQKNGGGCCSAVFAAETDVMQLLMNMLAGVVVEDVQHHNGKECCYLGTKGCIFLFKPIFCLNYNCTRITLGGRQHDLLTLEKRTGKLLSAQHDLEIGLIDFLRKRGNIFATRIL